MSACPHGMPSPGSCVDCMEDGNLPPPPRPKPPQIEVTFTARYAGTCRGCNLAIHEGQTIHRMSDESYRHEGCA